MSQVRPHRAEIARTAIPLLILAAGVGGFLVFGQRPEVPQREGTAAVAASVETAAVHEFQEELTLEVEGVAVPYRQVTISAEVSGRIVAKETSSRAGSFVDQDDFLLEIDPTDYQLEVTRIERELAKSAAEVASVEVDIANSRALLALAEEELVLRGKELQRRERLFASKSISESELEDSQRLELAARNGLQTMQNQLASFRQQKQTLEAARELVEVQLQRAQVDRQRTRVHSAVTGTISKDYVEQEDFVNKGDPLYLLTDARHMEVQCSLRIDQLYWLWLQAGTFVGNSGNPESVFEVPQTDVEVVFEFDGQQYVWEGRLSRYEGTGLDADTRLVPCRVRVDEPTQVKRIGGSSEPRPGGLSVPMLFTGMYVTVRIPVRAPEAMLSVPAAALRAGGQVWVVEDGALRVETVTTALVERERVILRRPLEERLRPGDRVVVSPLPNPRTGMAVAEVHRP